MSARTTKTFEDRLLDELKRELALRVEDAPVEDSPVVVPSVAEPSSRRRITTRRALVALAACAAAVGGAVALPASTGGAQAYAVERHEDGSVTVSLEEILLSRQDKEELTDRLRVEGIHVSVDKPRSGYVCAHPRGEVYQPLWSLTSSGDPSGVMPKYEYTLRSGDWLVFEEPEPAGRISPDPTVYAVKGAVKPCAEVPWDGKRPFEEAPESK
ncbi:hypothetical protein ACH4Y0_00585 [Streptomyces sp. NPDC020707]|uniref:DUF4430 domain-containing protein n=1 Tax=Streptomyces ortus TaxID=2867268 RepID=A0ABT3V474_9ACTN|nr:MULTISPECIES: hypothetical protein [Streptomyces]MCX4234785.1 hypothetical protein [Streptomyces ortus]